MKVSATQADWYHGHATVQRQVADDLAALIREDARRHKRILEIGCGTGFLTRHLDPACVLAIDPSSAMVERARRELPEHTFHVSGLQDLPPRKTADFLVSSSALHWVPPIEETVKLLAALAPRVAFALMLDGTLDELHAVRHAVAPELPPRLRMPSPTRVAKALRGAGFDPLFMRVSDYEASFPTARAFLHDLQRSGLSGRGPALSPSQIREIERRLEAIAPVTARFRVGFFQGELRKDCKKL